jgi:transposase InsO family protein
VLEARVLYFDWCDVYNRRRPHSSLGYLPPEAFARMIKTGDLDPLVPLS